MTKSETIAALSAALCNAQSELKNPHFDSVNPHFKSKFASLGAVRESVIPVFTANGLAVTQWPVSENGAAGCVTHLAHKSGEWMEERFLIPVDKQNAHGYASAVTYSKRISLMSVAGVVGDIDDDGNTAVGDNVAGKAKDAPGKGPTITPTTGAWESMGPDEQIFLQDIANNARALFKRNDIQGAWDEIESSKLRQDELLALWTRLESAERSALKKIGPFTMHHEKEAA